MAKRLALVVGISDYGEGFDPLPGSLQDMREMQKMLADPDRGAFEVNALENCDRTHLETQIETLFAAKQAEDVVLFYFSGHGDLGRGGLLHQQLHFCTHNSYKQEKRLVESSALSARFLKRQMDLSRSQRIIVILDCCYSGAIADLLQKGEQDIDFEEFRASGRVVLASSSASNVALQEKDGLSLYTRYLLEGMKGAAYSGQGHWIAARNLHDYADRRFSIENKGYAPKIIAEETGFDLPIVRAPKPDPTLEYQQAVDRLFQELDDELGLDFGGVIDNVIDGELDRASLETLRKRLELSKPEAERIEQEFQRPYLVRAEQRREYAKYFQMATKNGCLPSDRARRRLSDIRKNLLLGEPDADRIEQLLIQQLNLTPSSTVPTPAPKVTPTQTPPAAPTPSQPLNPDPVAPKTPSRYTQLEDYLKTQQWREADRETYRLMITTVGKKEGDRFSKDDLLNFPCEDLKTIDRLWVNYSNGKWGFSVQKQIWQECGSPMDYNDDWKQFGDRVGWRKDGDWLYYDDLTFSLDNSLSGEFPIVGVCWWGRRGFLFFRATTCEL